jgi:predicted Zn-dependent protease
MRFPLLLAAFGSTALLGGCATTPRATVTAEDQKRLEQLSTRNGRSPYGLFLAGQAALGAGRAEEAAALFARARQRAPENEVLRSRAFTAALTAGNIDRAASLAAELETAAKTPSGLGRLARAVDALADNRGRDAYALLNNVELEAPHGLAAEILKPWTAAAAGDFPAALDGSPARPPAAGSRAGEIDPIALARSLNQAGRLVLLERAGRIQEADALLPTLIASEAPPRQLLTAGAYLERRRRFDDAAALYARVIAERASTPTFNAALARAQARRAAPVPSLRAGAAEALIIPAAALRERTAV